MGNTFEVYIWRGPGYHPDIRNEYELAWRGESLLGCLRATWRAKRHWPKNCVKVEWR